MEFLTYKKVYEEEQAQALTKVLSQHGIESQIVKDRDNLAALYGYNQLTPQFFIKIRSDDFTKANCIFSELGESAVSVVDRDHYLYGFTDEELFDILSKPDEWSELDYQLAKKILTERGKAVNPEIVDLLKKQRFNELAKPEERQSTWIFAGYVFAFLGGLLGVFIGWHLSTFKKTLPNGERIYAYTREDRIHGRRILVMSLIMVFLTLVIRISTSDYD